MAVNIANSRLATLLPYVKYHYISIYDTLRLRIFIFRLNKSVYHVYSFNCLRKNKLQFNIKVRIKFKSI